MSETKPLLTVGVIFKNEIRCLERCFKSVENLKSKVPCELVVADTGSDDGSHAVAERYADVLIDFPWINDFAAARNAVIDRASGIWFMTMDADEWLDENVSELTKFLRSPAQWKNIKGCSVLIRNYSSMTSTDEYSDFVASRIFYMSSGIRYEGAIHEHWNQEVNGLHVFGKTILHHDGYVGFGGEQGRAKRERNLNLLKEKLENEPDNLLLYLQCVESSIGQEQLDFIRTAVDGVKKKLPNWKNIGPAIMRYAVFAGQNNSLPEYQEWSDMAWELFPDSLFTLIDVAYAQFERRFAEKKYDEAISLGKKYLKAVKLYRSQKYTSIDILYSSLAMISTAREENLRIKLTEALFENKCYRDAKGMLPTIDVASLSIPDYLRCCTVLFNVHSHSSENMGQSLLELWSKISGAEDADVRKAALIGAVKPLFNQELLDIEDKNGYRHAYTAFLPLEGKCWPGDAAALMEKDKPAALDKILARQEDLNVLPAAALIRAMERGAAFPLPDRPLKLEEMDAFAAHLLEEKGDLAPLALSFEKRDFSNMQELCWARAVVMAAVRSCVWDGAKQDFELARAFASVESVFLRRCYAPDVLDEDNILTLPPMHRFGWYCARAFDALNANNAADYVRLLRKGFEVCQDMRPMVDFLHRDAEQRNREQRIHDAPPELVQLAEQVKAVLAMYPVGDPAVNALKNSAAYQKVAWLIEEPSMMMAGGIAQ